jgi:hypothetical protein
MGRRAARTAGATGNADPMSPTIASVPQPGRLRRIVPSLTISPKK